MSSDVSHPAWPQSHAHGGAQCSVVTHKGHVISDALEMPLARVNKRGTIRIRVKNHHFTDTNNRGSSLKLGQLPTFTLPNINVCNGCTYMTPTTNKRADHFLGVVFNKETHGNLSFGSFGRHYAVKANYPDHLCPGPLGS